MSIAKTYNFKNQLPYIELYNMYGNLVVERDLSTNRDSLSTFNCMGSFELARQIFEKEVLVNNVETRIDSSRNLFKIKV